MERQIEKEELRIGNIVNYEGLFVEWHFGHWLGVDEGNYGMPTEHLLTSELIKSLGYTKWKNKKIWTKDGIIIYYHSKHGFCYGESRSRTKLKAIHDLQNLHYGLTKKTLSMIYDN